jgi:hypothetical protein
VRPRSGIFKQALPAVLAVVSRGVSLVLTLLLLATYHTPENADFLQLIDSSALHIQAAQESASGLHRRSLLVSMTPSPAVMEVGGGYNIIKIKGFLQPVSIRKTEAFSVIQMNSERRMHRQLETACKYFQSFRIYSNIQ